MGTRSSKPSTTPPTSSSRTAFNSTQPESQTKDAQPSPAPPSSEPQPLPIQMMDGAMYVDHGTGETKVYKIVLRENVPVTSSKRPSWAPISATGEGPQGETVSIPEITELALYDSLGDECARAISTKSTGPLPQQVSIKTLIETHRPQYVFVGTTAWNRTASDAVKVRVQQYFTQLSSSTNIPTDCRILTGEDESAYEANAVQFAAKSTGLPTPAIILSSGGGSLQISLAIPAVDVNDAHWFNCSLNIGFRNGIEVLQNSSLGSYAQRLEHWKSLVLTEISKIGPMIPNHFIQTYTNLNIVAISACYYASKAAKIDRHYVNIEEAIQKLPQTLNDVPDEKNLKSVANSVIQTELLRAIHARTNKPTNIHFSRDWKIEGIDFRTTWCAGKFLKDNRL
jgi:hypothetical protein